MDNKNIKEKKKKKEKKVKEKLNENDQNDDISNDKQELKCRRGFKICRNNECGQLVHIHKKKCPHCEFGFEFLLKQSPKLSPVNMEEKISLKKRKKGDSEPEAMFKKIKQNLHRVSLNFL